MLQDAMKKAIDILDSKPTTDDRLWDSSIEEALSKVAHQIENTFEVLDDVETEMIKQVLIKGHTVINENKKNFS